MQPYHDRRQRLAQLIRERGGGVAVIATAPEVIRNRDAHYPYRWDSYFYYLTGFTEPEAVLVLSVDGSGAESRLFCRDKNEEREIWDGYRFGPQLAREKFGFDQALSIDKLDEELPRLLADRPAIFTAIGADSAQDARVARWLNSVRGQARAGVSAPGQVFEVRSLIDDMRLIKDAHEIDIMRRAADISAAAHVRAMRASRPGRFEFEIEAELEHEFRIGGSKAPAYGSIVASGRHACVLHYRANDARLTEGELLLIDAGCELEGYASDITRTFPVSGRFSGAQRTLYDIVLEAQQAAIAATRPGMRFIDPHNAAVKVLAQGLIDCGLISGPLDTAIESGAYRRFYMHRTGHWLGMDVHDCGDYREPGEAATGSEKPWRILRPGMVLTEEPGLYVRAADDIPRHFHDIGIRIEDDALVTESGCEILTAKVPKAASDIEALMRG
ncbi:MAG: aminopeptidase P N-terminal domain-containing protein [Betaproteobacteria bacterium]|nr:aminopeptidase P N-terminal domain-containing protein [Betaproteobacteria bacterium]